ncbi:MAG: lipoprotein-releasing ABC transporter permease subunit [Pseudomonadota bacterium]
MFHPLSLYVGLRYVRARSHRFFVSFITWVSLAGVAVGVAALIVILSVMNGFEGELRDRLLSLSAQVRVAGIAGKPTPDWDALAVKLRGVPGVTGVTPYVELQVLAVHQPEMLPLLLRGIHTEDASAEGLKAVLTEGSIEALASGEGSLIIGRIVADQLGLGLGDALTLLVPVVGAGGVPDGRLREFTVGGIFEAGIQDHDATLAFASLSDIQAMGAQSAGSSGLRIAVQDVLAAPQIAANVATVTGPGLLVRSWTDDHASYFRAIRIEKTMMAIILLLIVAVAAFNIVAMLVMVVTDKRTDIAILRTLGASPRRVAAVFLVQGLVIGWLGVAAGMLLGVLTARNVGAIAPLIERVLGVQFMNADVYYITRIPSVLEWQDVGLIGGLALLLTTLATVYPAWRAAGTSAAEALRYE